MGIAAVSRVSVAHLVARECRFYRTGLRLSWAGSVKPTAGSAVAVGAMYPVMMMSLESLTSSVGRRRRGYRLVATIILDGGEFICNCVLRSFQGGIVRLNTLSGDHRN